MQVILRQDVEKIGLRGEVVDVTAGYARNYLLPRKLAETATPAKVAELRKHEEKRAKHEAPSFEQAQEIATRLEGTELRFDVRAGDTGTLFGSVTATDIVDEVWRALRVRVDRRKLDLPESIKRIGPPGAGRPLRCCRWSRWAIRTGCRRRWRSCRSRRSRSWRRSGRTAAVRRLRPRACRPGTGRCRR